MNDNQEEIIEAAEKLIELARENGIDAVIILIGPTWDTVLNDSDADMEHAKWLLLEGEK